MIGNVDHQITILGTGAMGAALAALALDAGYAVATTGSGRQPVEDLAARVHALQRYAGSEGRLRIVADAEEAARGAAIVIECLPEDRELKVRELRAAERSVARDAVLATNTSSLRVSDIAGAMTTPGRVIGLHYLNPPARFPFVELILAEETTQATVERARAFALSCGHRPVLVAKDVAGGVINRLQFALLREALELVEEGVVSAEDLDYVVEEGLAPRWAFAGPLATVELGGSTLFATLAAQLFPQLSQRSSPTGSIARRSFAQPELTLLRTARSEWLARYQRLRSAHD